MVKLTPDQQAAYLRASPEVFRPASGAWGRGGATIVCLRDGRRIDGPGRPLSGLAKHGTEAAHPDVRRGITTRSHPWVVASSSPTRRKPDKEEQLLAAVKKHLQVLQAEHLATDKTAYVMRAGDGTIIEVFEWRSAEAIKQAHTQSIGRGPLGRIRRRLRLYAPHQAGRVPADVRGV